MIVFDVFTSFVIKTLPGVPEKNFPYLSCYFSKSLFYLIKIMKEISFTIVNLDLSICFISVSARIDFL